MKIYEFKSCGETDWVFAPDMDEAKLFYLNFTGCGDLTATKIEEVDKSKWKEMYLLDINESEPDEDEEYNEDDYSCGYKIIENFEGYALRNTVTDMIATTAY
tara:strand:- start:278 stop:583 length:306 start_codon:yes stop_codon:yes gene_type:complete